MPAITHSRTKTREAPAGAGRWIMLASPRGFCAGVRRATEMMDAALAKFGSPVYCLREIVHNTQVVEAFRSRGVVFVASLDAVPHGATVIFSAHGVSPAVTAEAVRRQLNVVDAACPFVTRVHKAVRRYAARGFTVIMIGHRNHDEVVGVVGEAPDHVLAIESADEARCVRVPDEKRVAVVTQTTLSHVETGVIREILRERFPALETQPGDDVCYATMNRQKAALELAAVCDAVLVLGSLNSSNTRRLAEVTTGAGATAFIISNSTDLDTVPLDSCASVGVTAGASTPDSFVDEITGILRQRGFGEIREMCVAKEDLLFPLPKSLRG